MDLSKCKDSEQERFVIDNKNIDSLENGEDKCCPGMQRAFGPCMKAEYPEPRPQDRLARIRYAVLCPPHGNVARMVTLILAVGATYGVLVSLLKSEALPGGNIFALFLLVVLAQLGGAVVELIKLPCLLGMMLVGILLRNVPVVNYGNDIDKTWSSTLRALSLTVILLRAGLGLDPKALWKFKWVTIRIAFFPSLAECVVAAVVAKFLLGFPWLWAFILGFVLSAVSPAVVVPSMIRLQEKGLGINKGIPTLLIAACSLNDVIAISGFTIVLGITFSQASLTMTILHGPLEALIGIAFGIVVGVLLWYLPHNKHESRVLYRFTLAFLVGVLSVLGARRVHFPGAGALGCLVMAFVAGYRWRQQPQSHGAVVDIFGKLWKGLFQPLLFGLIGTEIDIHKLEKDAIGLGIAVLFIGLTVRVIVAYGSSYGSIFNKKEKLFFPFAWLPKATVQAAIGPVALDMARQHSEDPDSDPQVKLGLQVLSLAVLSILITAPLGAAAIALTAPKLLQRSKQDVELVPKQLQKDSSQEINQ